MPWARSILDGTSYAGVQATATVTRRLQSLAPKGTRLFIATDQEGGQVQRLQGPGFTRIVSARAAGRDRRRPAARASLAAGAPSSPRPA